MTTQKQIENEIEEAYNKDYNYEDFGFQDVKHMINKVETEGEYESAIWDQGYIYGLRDALKFLNEEKKFFFKDEERGTIRVSGSDITIEEFRKENSKLTNDYVQNDIDRSGYYDELQTILGCDIEQLKIYN